jgi:hypothetical protein
MPLPVSSEIVGFSHDPAAAARGLERARQVRLERQALAVVIDGYEVRPDCPPGVGWIVESMTMPGVPRWYLASKELALAAVERHRARCSSAAVV